MTISERRRLKVKEIPPKHRKVLKHAFSGRSRKAAIRAFCLECCGYSAKEVALCTDVTCPLYDYRFGGMTKT